MTMGRDVADKTCPRSAVKTATYRDDELRRAFRRARTVENNAPADPTSARTTVGFSGESVQPVWACNGAAINRKSADQKRNCTDLFIFFSTSPINLLEQKALRQPPLWSDQPSHRKCLILNLFWGRVSGGNAAEGEVRS